MGARRYEIYLRVFKPDISRAWTQEDKKSWKSLIDYKTRYQHMWKIIVSQHMCWYDFSQWRKSLKIIIIIIIIFIKKPLPPN
jgi:hypothetical protein